MIQPSTTRNSVSNDRRVVCPEVAAPRSPHRCRSRIGQRLQDIGELDRRFGKIFARPGSHGGFRADGLVSAGFGCWASGGPVPRPCRTRPGHGLRRARADQTSPPGRREQHAQHGVATDLLAPKKPLTVACIGSGFQARSQMEAIAAVRQIESVSVWSRTPEKREAFAERTGEELKVPAEVADSAEAAADGVDVLVTATWSKDPVVSASAVGSETLVLAMGSNHPNRRELPRAAGPAVLCRGGGYGGVPDRGRRPDPRVRRDRLEHSGGTKKSGSQSQRRAGKRKPACDL